MKQIAGWVLLVISIILSLGLLALWIVEPSLSQLQLAIKYWYLTVAIFICAFIGGSIISD